MSEVASLERALQLAEKRALEARRDAKQLADVNAKLQLTLRQARERLELAKAQIASMSQPPVSYGTVTGPLASVADVTTVEVEAGGRRLKVALDPALQPALLHVGAQVLLNESLVVIGVGAKRDTGETATVKELLGVDRVLASVGNEELVIKLTPTLCGAVRHGETLLVDRRAGVAIERLPRADVADLILEEVPDVSYEQIGGLDRQIEQVRDAVELPFLHRETFERYGLKAPKGVLLYGPPGTGKTMIAKAVAASLAARVTETTGGRATSYFLNIKGPELLNKYVGETERQIRVIFQRAREKATAGYPVIVFFDEMDSLFRTRGTGVSSDVENTIVPQLLSELDGIEGLANVIIIGASNREDMIDPAILRPGRLDVKIKLERPNAEAAREIFSKYLTPQIPLHASEIKKSGSAEKAVAAMIGDVVDFAYATGEENRFLEVTYAGGDKEVLYFKDFLSGAMISNIVGRAKKLAIKSELTGGQPGVSTDLLRQACLVEFAENEDLPNTTNPDDWARVSGRKGERIVYIRTLVGDSRGMGESVNPR